MARLHLRIGLASAVLGALAAVAVGLAVALGSTSGPAPPATGAADLVPANALLYVHVSTDVARTPVKQALALSRRLPSSALLFAAVTSRIDLLLGGSSGARVGFASDVRPWLGREAALAVLDTPGGTAGSLIVLDVHRRQAAGRFLATVGARPDGTYRGVSLLAQPSGAVLAFVRHYLVLGQGASVRAAIDVAAGRAPSLAASPQYTRAAGLEANDRVLDAYASADGVRRALEPRSGVLGELGALLDTPGLRAAAISISPRAGGLRVIVHRTLSSDHPSRQFGPSLARVLPAGSLLLLDVRGIRSGAPRLLRLAAWAGILGRIAPLLSRLGKALVAAGVNLRQVLSVFSGETAVAIAPARGGSGPEPVIVTRTAHPERTRALLAGLELPLTEVFAAPGTGPGLVPEVNDIFVAGVPVHELSLAPGFNLDYSVAHGLVVVSTGTGGIAGVFAHREAVSSETAFASVLADRPDQVTSLVFFDLSQLLRLGEQTGMIGNGRAPMLWPAVERIRAVGLASWRGANDTTTELQLLIQ